MLDTGRPTASAADAEGERRQLTVLFCDLVGSTSLAGRLDPEEWRGVVTEYQRSAGAQVARFGGQVAQYLGDGIVAHFGHPVAREHDAERAVRAGLAIVDALPLLNREVTSRAGVSLSVRIGIHTGPVVVEAGAGVFTAFGNAPNVAARVQTLAEPGDVLITGATHRLVAGLFVVEPLGRPSLKGVTEPVDVYRVRGASGARGRLEARVHALSPFVGRESERRLLGERWALARAGRGQAVFLTGDPGIGKSRLVQALRRDIEETPHTWLEMGGSPYFSNSPFHPVVELLRRVFDWPADATDDARIADLRRALSAVGVGPDDALPLLAPLLDLPLAATGASGSPEEQRRKLFATLVAWLLGVARLQPVVLVLEDLQWLDASTAELQTILAGRASEAPILLVCTARSEFRLAETSAPDRLLVVLSQLEERQAREMVRAVAGQPLRADLLDSIIARAEGVPLFLEELTRHVMEQSSGGDGSPIPTTLHDLLMARLDRLARGKRIAQVGAVLGREFSYGLLRAVVQGSEAELQVALGELTDAGLILCEGVVPEARYAFRHALIQDAAYASLLHSRRRDLHATIAGILRDSFPDVYETQPEVAAHHHSGAGEAEAALVAWQRAAERSAARSALVEAGRHYDAALHALAALPDEPARDERELLLQMGRGRVFLAIKGFATPEVRDIFGRTLALSERLGDRVPLPVLVGLWASTLNSGHYRVAQELADQMVAVAGRDGSPASRAWAHTSQGVTRFHLGDLTGAWDHLDRVRRIPVTDVDFAAFTWDPRVWALLWASYAAALRGFCDTAQACMDDAMALAARLDRVWDRLFGQVCRAGLSAYLLDADRTLPDSETVIVLAHRSGLPVVAAAAEMLRGWAVAKRGDTAAGVAEIRRALDKYTATGGHSFLPLYLVRLADVMVDAPARERLAVLDDALRAGTEQQVSTADVLRLRAELLAEAGEDAAAVEATFRDALAVAERQGARLYELRTACSLARWLAGRGRAAEGRALLSPMYAWFTEGLETRDLRDAAAFLDELDRLPAAGTSGERSATPSRSSS